MKDDPKSESTLLVLLTEISQILLLCACFLPMWFDDRSVDENFQDVPCRYIELLPRSWQHLLGSNSDQIFREKLIRETSKFMFSTSKLILREWTLMVQPISDIAHLFLPLKLTLPLAQAYSNVLDPFQIWHHGNATESRKPLFLRFISILFNVNLALF